MVSQESFTERLKPTHWIKHVIQVGTLSPAPRHFFPKTATSTAVVLPHLIYFSPRGAGAPQARAPCPPSRGARPPPLACTHGNHRLLSPRRRPQAGGSPRSRPARRGGAAGGGAGGSGGSFSVAALLPRPPPCASPASRTSPPSSSGSAPCPPTR